MVVLILALGWMRLKGEQLGYYPANFGTALFAVTLSSLFLMLVGWATVTVGRADRERKAANLALLGSKVELEESLREIQLIIDHAREIICTIDQDGKLLTISSGVEPILGWRAKELLGSFFSALHLAGRKSNPLFAKFRVALLLGTSPRAVSGKTRLSPLSHGPCSLPLTTVGPSVWGASDSFGEFTEGNCLAFASPARRRPRSRTRRQSVSTKAR